jgi:AcrR family transcriptional regulator
VGVTAARADVVETVPPIGGREGVVRHLGADDRSSTRVRLVDGALRCLARQGIAKTTVDDIARAAGLSRATAYRLFPRGKEGILAAVVETEVARLFSALAVAMGEAGDLEDVLVAGMVESARWLRGHEPLTYLLEHEPGAVLPYLTFGGFDQVMRVASDLGAPFFARWLEPEQASRAAEWAVRIVMAYCSDPSPHADLTDPVDTRALVRTFVLPGILALRVDATDAPTLRPGIGSTSRSTTSSTTISTTSSTTSSTGAPSPTRPTTKGAAQ